MNRLVLDELIAAAEAGHIPNGTTGALKVWRFIEEARDEDPGRSAPPEFHGVTFGIDWFDDEGKSCAPGPCVRLWGEDDDYWHLIETFDATWLPELARVANAAAMALPLSVARAQLKLRAKKYLETNDQRTDEARHLIHSLLLQVEP